MRLLKTALLTVTVSTALAAYGQPRDEQEGPVDPAPRNDAGRVLLGGANPQDKGVWTPRFGIFDPVAPLETVPFQPWAEALYADRQIHEFEPHARCKASGASRQFLTPYGVEIVEIAELDTLLIFDIGGPHTFRTVYMDGRSHPKDLEPSNYGHSVGWWDGDTLVIDTVGYNEDFWFGRRGLPHTEQLHTVEYLTRTDSATIDYEILIDDPGAYTDTFKGGFNLGWQEDTELFEYICQQANYADDLMVGGDNIQTDRTSAIIP